MTGRIPPTPLLPSAKGAKKKPNDFLHEDIASAALYFLKSGDYLLKWKSKDGITSKCVAAPDVAAAMSLSEIDSHWLPKGIVRHGYGPAGWWCVFVIEPQRVKLTMLNMESQSPQPPLQEGGQNEDATLRLLRQAQQPVQGSETEISIVLPHLVMLGIDKKYFLFALAAGFDPKEKAYAAPFPNVYPNGEICFGQNTPPVAEPGTMIIAWQLFMDAPFNGDLVTGKSQRNDKDIRLSLMDFSRKQAYPVRDLVSMGRTIAGVLEERIREKNVH